MAKPQSPALPAESVEGFRGSSYPAEFDAPCKERHKRILGDLFGLTDFGVNLVELPPGSWSAQRHWHSEEDEFVYVLSGHPTLITDEGETDLGPGMCAGFKAGVANGHHVVNRSEAPAVFLEIGSRREGDDGFYPDIDLEILKRAQGGRFTRKNGVPYE